MFAIQANVFDVAQWHGPDTPFDVCILIRKHLKSLSLSLTGGILAAIVLVACGGGGNEGSSIPTPTNPSASLSGVAAVGAAFANATITAHCVTGVTVTGTAGADGSFTLALDGDQVAPCMVRASGGSPALTLYGFASSTGRVNVTPLSDLVISNALGADPAATFAAFDAASAATIQAGLVVSTAYVRTQLQLVGGAQSIDILNGVFVVGDANDINIDYFMARVKAAGRSYGEMRGGAAQGAMLAAFLWPGVVAVDPSAPSVPGALVAAKTSSNSISLSWAASTGGAGGVYSYALYRNGQKIGDIGPEVTNYVDLNLNPGARYSYTVTATSVAGTSSPPSTVLTVSTQAFSLMSPNFLPYIVFEKETGRILAQVFASPGAIAAATMAPCCDVIGHARIDPVVYGIKSVGIRQYSIYPYSTGVSLDPPVAGTLIGTSVATDFSLIGIDMKTGAINHYVSGSGSTTDLLSNIGDGGGGYLAGEVF